jgi:predicted DNA-binding protein (UPF0251 family)
MLPVTSRTPESALIERSGTNAIRCAIEQLPVVFREVILLRDVEDASYQEIAETLSIPIGTVMSRLARARRVVRESLRSASGAPLARELSRHTETREKRYRSTSRERTTSDARCVQFRGLPAGFEGPQTGATVCRDDPYWGCL